MSSSDKKDDEKKEKNEKTLPNASGDEPREVRAGDPDAPSAHKILADEGSVRSTLSEGGIVHVDRPVPFIMLNESGTDSDATKTAAYMIATAGPSYLTAPQLDKAAPELEQVVEVLKNDVGDILTIEVSELENDKPKESESTVLPSFKVIVSATEDGPAQKAAQALEDAICTVEAQYRTPDIARKTLDGKNEPRLHLCFAPIYQQPDGEGMYPQLRMRLVGVFFDALLQAVEAFASDSGLDVPATHRAYGKRKYLDALLDLDHKIDDVSKSFDYLLSLTPINSDEAWQSFKDSGKSETPRLLYRPLAVDVNAQREALFKISFEDIEDPLLYDLYREKQEELALQLMLLELRGTPRFKDAGRLFYGAVDEALLKSAKEILAAPKSQGSSKNGSDERVDSAKLQEAADKMISDFREEWEGFDGTTQLRDDLPAGMVVSGSKLMIGSKTDISANRLDALLAHELGVHMFTYSTGNAQGLRLFRSGLAGYEAVQEGLGVFAEYLTGGLTHSRMRLLAARVVGCHGMLNGASFADTVAVLSDEYDFSSRGAFNITVRIYRAGGFAKDAIYLRGLKEVLDHVASGNPLEPFWIGKIATAHFSIIEELTERGLLEVKITTPPFLKTDGAKKRLKLAESGLSLSDLTST